MASTSFKVQRCQGSEFLQKILEAKLNYLIFFLVKSPKVYDDDGDLRGQQFEKFCDIQAVIRGDGEGEYDAEMKKEVGYVFVTVETLNCLIS